MTVHSCYELLPPFPLAPLLHFDFARALKSAKPGWPKTRTRQVQVDRKGSYDIIVAYLTIPSSHPPALDSEEDQTKERERENGNFQER